MQIKVVRLRPKDMTHFKSVASQPRRSLQSPPIYMNSSSLVTSFLGLLGFLVRLNTQQYTYIPQIYHWYYTLIPPCIGVYIYNYSKRV